MYLPSIVQMWQSHMLHMPGGEEKGRRRAGGGEKEDSRRVGRGQEEGRRRGEGG